MSPEQRLTLLESRCRILTRTLLGIVFVGGFALVLGAKQADETPRFKVTSLDVIDSKGNVRMSFGSVKEGPEEFFCARIFNAAGEQKVVINDQGQVTLGNPKSGEASVHLGAHDGSATIQLDGKSGRHRAQIYATETDKEVAYAGVKLVDVEGEARFIAETPRQKSTKPARDPKDPFEKK